MNKIQYKVISLKKRQKKIYPKINFINSINKSNLSTSNFSSINPDKNICTIESYEDINNTTINVNKKKPFDYNNSQNFLMKSTDNIHKDKKEQLKSYVYLRKNNLYKNNKVQRIENKENYNKKILLNNYRKMIMKRFLYYFRPYCLFFIRKYFYCFIRNITHLIMQKELFYKTNTLIKNKKTKRSRNVETTDAFYINKSSDNYKTIKRRRRINNKLFGLNKSKNMYLNMNEELEKDNDIKYSNNTIINTPQKTYAFKNIFISLNNKKKKNNYSFFIKKIKNIITKDKKLYITITYIFYYPKKSYILSNDISNELQRINSVLKITQIYSLEYLPSKTNEKLAPITEEEKEKNPIINMINVFHNLFILKKEKEFIYKLKVINICKVITKIINLIIVKKMKLVNKNEEITCTNDIFLVDDKMVINIDNIRNLN